MLSRALIEEILNYAKDLGWNKKLEGAKSLAAD